MHFREGARGYDVQKTIPDVMQIIPDVHRLPQTEIEIDPENIPDEVITLEPLQ